MPHQIFLVLIKTDRVNGVFAKDPFKFEKAKVEKVILRQNGLPIMVESHNTNFDNDEQKKCIITYVRPLMWDSIVAMSI